MKHIVALCALAATLLLAACGEKAQTAATKKADSKPWEGAQPAFMASGWKAGDQAGWEAQMKSRSQGQDEYSRAAAKP